MTCFNPALGALLCLLLASCSSTWSQPGDWVSGDVHVHSSLGSNDAEPDSTVEDIVAAARAQELDWLVITDHSNSAGSMDCPDVEDCPNQGPEFPTAAAAAQLSGADLVLAVGSELSPIETLTGIGGPVGHVGCLPPADGFDFEGAFFDRPPGDLDGAEILDQCHAVGGFAVVNHPFAQASWIRWDWSSDDFEAIEVWNAGLGWDEGDEQGLWAWECLVARGRDVVPLAASDSHDMAVLPGDNPLSPSLGEARTSVVLPQGASLDWPALRQALQDGPVTLHAQDSFVALQSILSTRTSEEWQVAGRIPGRARLEVREIPLEASCDPADSSDPLHRVVWDTDVDGVFTVSAGGLAPLDREHFVGRYLFLEQLDREPFSGGVAMTGLLPSPE